MTKWDAQIMVVKREKLFDNDYFEGFREHSKVDYESRILQNYKYKIRSQVENDPSLKQPVVYLMVTNPIKKKVFVYRRAEQYQKYPEKRLQGKWSWGVGGHVQKLKIKNANPLFVNLSRELTEEITIKSSINIKVLGYINNETDDVGKVHFGMLYVIEIDANEVYPKDPEIKEGKLRGINELEKIVSSPNHIVEEWSRIAIKPLKKYFSTK